MTHQDPYVKKYQDARAEAHQAADASGANHVVCRTGLGDGEGNGDFSILPELTIHPMGYKVLYIARPGTTTYLLYLQECDAEGISSLRKEEWIREGRLSLTNLRAKWGIKSGAQRAEENRERRKEEKAQEEAAAPVKPKKVLVDGKSNKVIVFDAYNSGEKDMNELFKLTEGRVKVVTIKSWISSWKKGTNLPAGRGELKK